jgi:hypothetical protein
MLVQLSLTINVGLIPTISSSHISARAQEIVDCGCEARACSYVGPVSSRPAGVRSICARVWSRSLVDYGVGPINTKVH